MNLREIPLRSVLDLTLPRLELTWAIRDEVLLVTTPAAAEEESNFATKVYSVSDLTYDSQRLGELIVGNVSPKSWVENGGTGTLAVTQFISGQKDLVISQSRKVHLRVADFLADLRTVASRPAAKLPVALSREGFWRQTPQSEAVRMALKKAIAWEMHDWPLQKMVDFVREQSRVNVVLDRAALSKAGIDPSRVNLTLDRQALLEAGIEPPTPVAKKIADIPLDRLLGLTLKGVQLAYTIEADSLVITSEEAASQRMSSAIYPVGDVVAPWRSVADRVKMLPELIRPDGWAENGGTGDIIGITGCAEA